MSKNINIVYLYLKAHRLFSCRNLRCSPVRLKCLDVSHDRLELGLCPSGHKLAENLAPRLKQAGLYAVRISIDSLHEAEHDR